MTEHKCDQNTTRNEVWVFDGYAIFTILGDSETGHFEHNERIKFCPLKECEEIPAKVWPVSMGDGKLIVEYENGRLGAIRICDIRLVADEANDSDADGE